MPYIGKSPHFGVRNRFIYTASADATSISGADANGATLTFTDGAYVDVYLNGILLKAGTDYVTTTANTIGSLAALSTSDEVVVLVYDVFSVSDTVSATSGGTFSGGLTINDGTTIAVDDNSDNLILTSTDADANSGPNLDFYRNSSSPADSDGTGKITFRGRNDNSQDVDFATIDTWSTDVSDGTEDGEFVLRTMNAGSSLNMFAINSTEIKFNEQSVDVDFRVESNGNANMLFVDGGNNRVGIGIGDPDQILELNDQSGADVAIHFAGNGVDHTIGTDASNGGYLTISNSATVGTNPYMIFGASGLVTVGGNFVVGGTSVVNSSELSVTAGTDARVVSLVCGGTSANDQISFQNGNGEVGTIRTSGSATSFNTSSDYRLKENVNYSWDATTRLKQLKPSRFNFKADADLTVDGFIAHEVSSIVPEAISGTKDGTQDLGIIKDKDGNVTQENALERYTKKDEGQTWTKTGTENVYQQIDQSKLVPLLVKTIQELEARVKALEDA